MDKQQIVKQIEKQEFKRNLAFYVLINLALTIVWFLSGKGYFFPAWSFLGWGILLSVQAISFFLNFEDVLSENKEDYENNDSSNIEFVFPKK